MTKDHLKPSASDVAAGRVAQQRAAERRPPSASSGTMFIKVPAELGQAILAYLDGRPHGEVRRLIDHLTSCETASDAPPEE